RRRQRFRSSQTLFRSAHCAVIEAADVVLGLPGPGLSRERAWLLRQSLGQAIGVQEAKRGQADAEVPLAASLLSRHDHAGLARRDDARRRRGLHPLLVRRSSPGLAESGDDGAPLWIGGHYGVGTRRDAVP